MASYRYIARDVSGGRREGLTQAASVSDVLGWLQDQGFTPVSVKEISTETKEKRRFFRPRRIRAAEIAAVHKDQ